jgi:hypothetical protein
MAKIKAEKKKLLYLNLTQDQIQVHFPDLVKFHQKIKEGLMPLS